MNKSVKIRAEDYNKLAWHAENQKRTLAAQISYYIAYWEKGEAFILPREKESTTKSNAKGRTRPQI